MKNGDIHREKLHEISFKGYNFFLKCNKCNNELVAQPLYPDGSGRFRCSWKLGNDYLNPLKIRVYYLFSFVLPIFEITLINHIQLFVKELEKWQFNIKCHTFFVVILKVKIRTWILNVLRVLHYVLKWLYIHFSFNFTKLAVV